MFNSLYIYINIFSNDELFMQFISENKWTWNQLLNKLISQNMYLNNSEINKIFINKWDNEFEGNIAFHCKNDSVNFTAMMDNIRRYYK